MPKIRTVRAFSAGGVLFRHAPGTVPTEAGARGTPHAPAETPGSVRSAACSQAKDGQLAQERRRDGAASRPQWDAADAAPAYAPPATSATSVACQVEVALVGRASEDFWVLPKGTPKPDETTEQVALREVAEETGVLGHIVGEIGSIHYWFSRRGVRYNKEVFYYLMEAVSGDVALHDHEYDDARWFPLDDAEARLTYTNEVDMLRRARKRIVRLSGGPAA